MSNAAAPPPAASPSAAPSPTDLMHDWVLDVFGVDPRSFAPAVAAQATPAPAEDTGTGTPVQQDATPPSWPKPPNWPQPPDPPDHPNPKLGSTVEIYNATGMDIKLVETNLQFPDTASFDPGPPAFIGARKKISFKVKETTQGPPKTSGWVRYHVDRKLYNTYVTMQWFKVTANINISDGPYYSATEAEADSEKGNRYEFVFKESDSPQPDRDLQIRIDIDNDSGHDLTLVYATLDDPDHSEFMWKPKDPIAAKTYDAIMVQALDAQHPDGAGHLCYKIEGAPNTPAVIMQWKRDGEPIGTITPNDGSFTIKSSGSGTVFQFDIGTHSGPMPSTRVNIINQSKIGLKLDDHGLDAVTAKFAPNPPDAIGGTDSISFTVQTTDASAPQTSGWVTYKPDQDDATWWVYFNWLMDGPPVVKVLPVSHAVQATATGGKDEVTLTITAVEQPAFTPPAKNKQPTLRKGDNSADGWVEYLQESLNHHLKTNLKVDGHFGQETYNAVIAFQTSHKTDGVMVDGIVGDETWSYLREGRPEKPATDGRQPHSFEQQGQQARWMQEKEVCHYDAGQDALIMMAISVGDEDPLKGKTARVRITNNDLKDSVVTNAAIGTGQKTSTTTEGWQHEVRVESLTDLLGRNTDGNKLFGQFTVEAYFDPELGGDSFSEVITIGSPV